MRFPLKQQKIDETLSIKTALKSIIQ